jgi:predicted dinucleotide-binding enzyme
LSPSDGLGVHRDAGATADMQSKPSIGIIGKGNVGSALAKGLRSAGYRVETTGRDPQRIQEIANTSTVLILAVPSSERAAALKRMGDAVRGKTLIDVTNNLTKDGEYGGNLKSSLAEETQKQAKEARVVKAFNTVFAQAMSSGKVNGEPLTLFVAGDDPEAKRQTRELGEAIGFESVDAGSLDAARWLEAMGYFNIRLGYDQKLGTNIGLRVSGVSGRSPQGQT